MTVKTPLRILWQQRKETDPDTVLFVKIGRFYHLFNDDVDRVNASGLLLEKHIINFESLHSMKPSLDKMWAIPETIIVNFLIRLDESMPDLKYECGKIVK